MSNIIDIISLLLVVFFTPIIIYSGIKNECFKKEKVIKTLSILAFLFELFRFFYLASLYERGEVFSYRLSFGFVSLLAILSLVYSFYNGKYKSTFKNVYSLLVLVPIIVYIFNKNSYQMLFDEYKISNGLFILNCGIYMFLSLDNFLNNKINIKDTILAFLVTIFGFFCSIFYSKIWSFSLPRMPIFAIEVIIYSISPFIIFAILKILPKFAKKMLKKN